MNRALCLLLLAVTAPVSAELSNVSETGFTSTHSIQSDAAPFVVYRTLTSHINQWWSPDHSLSGNAANLYLKVEPGGCFCEKLPAGGNVEHLRLIQYDPGKLLRFDGALGPLQAMPVNGRMTWSIEPLADSGSKVTFTYHVFGHTEGGLQVVAAAVDGVIGEQIQSLANRLDPR